MDIVDEVVRFGKHYRLSFEAKEFFNSVHDNLYLELSKHEERTKDILGPYLKRWSPYIIKISMLMQPFINKDTDHIGPEAIMGGISIVDQAIKSTTFLFKNELGETPQQRKQRLVLEYIAKRGGKVKRNNLLGSKILDGGKKDYDYVIETMLDTGEIAVEPAAEKKNLVYVLCEAEDGQN